MSFKLVYISVFFWSIGVFGQTVSTVPERTDDNVIVASYNIKWIGQTKHDFKKLAKVIANFDVCGIIEVKKETAIADLVQQLKSLTKKDWGYVYGFRTTNPSGNYYEAYAVIFRRDRVQLGDGVISNVWDPREAYRNDPFVVSLKRGNFDFSMFLVHTRWSNDNDGTREEEVQEITAQVEFYQKITKERDLIIMGDFNYPGTKVVMKEMATKLGYIQCDLDPLTTFKQDYSAYANPYDHIYISKKHTADKEYVAGSAQAFDVTKYIYGNNSKASMKKSKSELSDHLPVFAVFKTNLRDDD